MDPGILGFPRCSSLFLRFDSGATIIVVCRRLQLTSTDLFLFAYDGCPHMIAYTADIIKLYTWLQHWLCIDLTIFGHQGKKVAPYSFDRWDVRIWQWWGLQGALMRILMPNSFFWTLSWEPLCQTRFSQPSNENPYAKLVFLDPLMRILIPKSFFLVSVDSLGPVWRTWHGETSYL